jgi:DNA-binding Xre family transcriptional regulator
MAKRRKQTRRVIATSNRHPGGAPRTHQSCPLGERIEELAAACRLTLPEVAERAGISVSGMNDIRRGRFRPRLDTLDKIADVLGVSSGRLISG